MEKKFFQEIPESKSIKKLDDYFISNWVEEIRYSELILNLSEKPEIIKNIFRTERIKKIIDTDDFQSLINQYINEKKNIFIEFINCEFLFQIKIKNFNSVISLSFRDSKFHDEFMVTRSDINTLYFSYCYFKENFSLIKNTINTSFIFKSCNFDAPVFFWSNKIY